MKIKLDFGKDGLLIDVPDRNIVKILSKNKTTPIPDSPAKIKHALENPSGCPPLSHIAQKRKSACIVIDDITRPVPNKMLLPPILSILENNGIARDNITIMIATGIHRPNIGDELLYLVGAEISAQYRVVNHLAKDRGTHDFLGTTSRGTEVFVDSTYLQADLNLATGLIEPHLMAGFSGGRKSICPGICSLDTVRLMHSPRLLEHPQAREGMITGNPFHEEALEIARMAGVDYIVNVALDDNRQLTGIFTGDLERAHATGVSFVRATVTDSIDNAVDIVITTSAGFPLDATLYQSIKGLTAALPIINDGGTIILAAECREGLGSPEFSQLVRQTTDLDQFMSDILSPDYFVVDQWQMEELAKVLKKAEVFLYASGLQPDDKAALLLKSVDSVEQGIQMALERHGKHASIAVIPEGPYVLAELAANF
jgi:nickel-dependent lactate racemase